LLKIYIYGYLNRIQSSRRLERESQRNVELIWLTGRLSPDFKTIAYFRKDNGKVIRGVCREFVVLCLNLGLFSEALVAIDGSKFKAVNGRDRNFTDHKLKARMQQLEESVARYLAVPIVGMAEGNAGGDGVSILIRAPLAFEPIVTVDRRRAAGYSWRDDTLGH
jgi:hypothetical protein